jgi:hypothetical protein
MFAILLVAACASAPHAPGRSKDPDLRRLEVIEDIGARACACTDRACAEELDEELAKAIAASPAPRLFENAEVAPRVEAAAHEALACFWTQGHVARGFEGMVFEAAEGLEQKACSCQASGCKVEVSREEVSRSFHLRAFPVGDGRWKELNELRSATSKCLAEDRAPVPDSPIADDALAAYQELRDGICGCKDLACAKAYFPEYMVWLRHYGSLVPSTAQSERLNTVFAEARACTDALQEPAP